MTGLDTLANIAEILSTLTVIGSALFAVIQIRIEQSQPSWAEWFQWLAEQLDELGDGKEAQPAYVKHAQWRPRF